MLAKLKPFANLCVVADETSATGYTVQLGPFPGSADVPDRSP